MSRISHRDFSSPDIRPCDGHDGRAGSKRVSSKRKAASKAVATIHSWRLEASAGAANDKRLAQLAFLCPEMGRALGLFLMLWDCREQMTSYEKLATHHCRFRKAGSLQTLRQMIQRRAWPVTIKNEFGKGYRLSVKQPGWTWERDPLLHEPDVEIATDFMIAAPDISPRTALLVGILWHRRNRLVSTGELAERWQSLSGRRATRWVLVDAIRCARDTISQYNWRMEIINVAGVGYKLKVDDGCTPYAQRAQLPSDPLAFENVAVALTCLGQSRRRIGEFFMLLWSRRSRTISFARIEEEFHTTTGDFISQLEQRALLVALRAAIRKRSLPIKILTIKGIGFRLEVSQFDHQALELLTALPCLVDADEMDIVARLADRFPECRPAELRVLKTMVQSQKHLTHIDLSERYIAETGVETPHTKMRLKISRIRKALASADAPASIETERELGYLLVGDLTGWLTKRPTHRCGSVVG